MGVWVVVHGVARHGLLSLPFFVPQLNRRFQPTRKIHTILFLPKFCLSLPRTHSSSRSGLLLAFIHFTSRSLPIASRYQPCLSSWGLLVHCIICQRLPSPREFEALNLFLL
ncbi:hypothetical protein L211DRAFT_237569 [Terfezia boudieri ATCC MYA-4762]|uniref:Uncharacterized protein n=1 Tax=Terfezia boudieri ATCC MYA-4762 TaxID=1051890 RepID=A0A3N4M0V0_9PEZI|nr:hypothetical protein L211DRAFT_237569 [Terfezia boudieri ATCC MYA-4762]